jgi:hypothetical protein
MKKNITPKNSMLMRATRLVHNTPLFQPSVNPSDLDITFLKNLSLAMIAIATPMQNNPVYSNSISEH